MLCQLCEKSEATIHLTREVAGLTKTEIHLCETCLPPQSVTENNQQELIAKLFAQVSAKQKSATAATPGQPYHHHPSFGDRTITKS